MKTFDIHESEDVTLYKKTVPSKMIYRINAIPIRAPAEFFLVESDKHSKFAQISEQPKQL